jgi:hypothetical protein
MIGTETGGTIIAMERRNSLQLVVVVAIGAIAVGVQAAGFAVFDAAGSQRNCVRHCAPNSSHRTDLVKKTCCP